MVAAPTVEQVRLRARYRERAWQAPTGDLDLIAFTERMFPRYQVAPHHRQIAEHLEAMERGEITRLIVTMPPRHGKSCLASEHLPPWFLGRNPDLRMIGCSHTATLAYLFSRRARNILNSPRYPFPIRVASDLGAVQSWDIANHLGGYVAAGVGGSITGMGANVLLIDDPVKNAEDAESQTVRESTWEWFTGTAHPRLEPNGAIVVIGTRWHEDDLIGRLLQSDRWTVLHLPALNADGQALWPERFDEAALAQKRIEIGERNFVAQYQGRPSPPEGAILKREWWQYWRLPPAHPSATVQVWDTAFKTGEQNDWSVGATWQVAAGGYYLRDRYRARIEFPGLKRAVAAQALRWEPTEILIEDAASGQSLIQELKSETRLPIIAVPVDRDKVARVNAVSPHIEAGKCFLPASASFLDEFIEEHAGFPYAEHDDQVDTTAMFLARQVLHEDRRAHSISYIGDDRRRDDDDEERW